jgi:NADH-quinone oxidoreductase subunit J
MTLTPDTILFFILAAISIVAALLMISDNQNPVRSALYLVLTLICVAVFYITLSAQFIAAVQIIVYAGAIMVLFLFVIMLLNLGAPQALHEKGRLQKPVAWILGLIFAAVLASSGSLISLPRQNPSAAAATVRLGTVQAIGASLYDPAQSWLFPFEITSILLLVAIVGAIIMAKRRI